MKKELSYIFHLLSHKLFDLEKYSLKKFNQVFFTRNFSFINHITQTPTDFKQSLLLAKIHIQN